MGRVNSLRRLAYAASIGRQLSTAPNGGFRYRDTYLLDGLNACAAGTQLRLEQPPTAAARSASERSDRLGQVIGGGRPSRGGGGTVRTYVRNDVGWLSAGPLRAGGQDWQPEHRAGRRARVAQADAAPRRAARGPRVRRRRAGAVPRRRGAVRSAADQRAPALGRRGATRVRRPADPRGPRPGAGRRGALRPAGAPPRDRSRSVSGAMASAIDVGGPVARRAGRNSPPGPATTTDCERWAHAVKVASSAPPASAGAPCGPAGKCLCSSLDCAAPHLRSEVAGGGERQHPARETLRLLRPAAEWANRDVSRSCSGRPATSRTPRWDASMSVA